MPLYALKCPTCGAAFESFEPANARDAITSPCCHSGRCETDYGAQSISLDRVFGTSQSMSIRYACHPTEVDEMRKLFPSARVDAKGRVFFDKRSDAKKFEKDRVALRQKTKNDSLADQQEMQRCFDKGYVEVNGQPA